MAHRHFGIKNAPINLTIEMICKPKGKALASVLVLYSLKAEQCHDTELCNRKCYRKHYRGSKPDARIGSMK